MSVHIIDTFDSKIKEEKKVKITVEEVDCKIESGDILVCWHDVGEKSVYLFSNNEHVVQLINLRTGAVDFSISKDRGYENLVSHMIACCDKENSVIDCLISKQDDIELKISRSFTL